MKHTLLGIIAAAVSVTAAIIAIVAIRNYSEKKKGLDDDYDCDFDDDCGCDYDDCGFDEYDLEEDFDEDFSCEDECDIDDFEEGKDLDELLDEEAAADEAAAEEADKKNGI